MLGLNVRQADRDHSLSAVDSADFKSARDGPSSCTQLTHRPRNH